MIGYFYYKLEMKESPLRARLNGMQNKIIQKVRDYVPIDDESVVTVYHVELGFLRGISTLEVCDRVHKKTAGEYIQYEGTARIVGTRRAIKRTAKKLEKMCTIKLNLDEIREKD